MLHIWNLIVEIFEWFIPLFSSSSTLWWKTTKSVFHVLFLQFKKPHFLMYHSVKRSMKNKLGAQICKAVLVTNFTTPVFTWRFLVGLVNENLSILILFIRNIDAVIMVLCFTEIIAFRFLLLFGWKHFNSTNEEFMFGFLSLLIRLRALALGEF